jgi:hypothetical protein
VPASLAALGHDDVRPDIQSPPCFVEIGDLDDQAGTRAADVLGEGCGVPEGQHDCRGAVRERPVERGGRERPGEEADAPRSVGPVRHDSQLALAPIPFAPAAADQPQPAAGRHGRRERAPGGASHRRERDGVGDGEQVSLRGRQ